MTTKQILIMSTMVAALTLPSSIGTAQDATAQTTADGSQSENQTAVKNNFHSAGAPNCAETGSCSTYVETIWTAEQANTAHEKTTEGDKGDVRTAPSR